MAEFTVNASRRDPYKNMKFKVKWDGKYVAGVSKVSPLKRTTETVTYREGGGPTTPLISPGSQKTEPITMERGLTFDPEFEAWANLVYSDIHGEISLKNFRKDIILELLNEQGVVVKSYKIYRCWVSEYQSLPELDANAHAVAIERIVLQNEGWERDTSVVEVAET